MRHPATLSSRCRVIALALALLPAIWAFLWGTSAQAQDLTELLKLEEQRVAVIKKVKPSVVAIFAAGGKNGGTGVIIDKEGYALTNFHVVQATGPTPKCGLADGLLYDSVLVGLDKVGDVALIKLLPRKEGVEFKYSEMGNSDTVNEGDFCLALGNPFLLATDFTPTVTFGLVSGVHRYQYPAGTFLEYTDCIQIDASINPGNSGGPLYNTAGELVGINGRGSFDKRGRVNSGVGYAISINQIKNFLGHLRSGLDTDHATLGASVATPAETSGISQVQVDQVLPDSDAAHRGLAVGDIIHSFAGRPITGVNHLKNVLGLYPRGWRLPMEFRHKKDLKEVLVRLQGVQRKVIKGAGEPKIIVKGGGAKGPAAKFYEPVMPRFANYYFNRQERERLMTGFAKHGDFKTLTGDWTIEGTLNLGGDVKPIVLKLQDEKVGGDTRPVVKLSVKDFPYSLAPLHSDVTRDDVMKQPEGSGGFLLAMYIYRELLTEAGGDKGFTKLEFHHGGVEPIFPPAADGKAGNLMSRRVDAEVINAVHGFMFVKLFFSKEDKKLLAMEVRIKEKDDPCEVYFSDYRAVDGRQLPHRMDVLHANGPYGTFNLKSFNLKAGS